MTYSNTFSDPIRGTKVYAEIRCIVDDTSQGTGYLAFGLADVTLGLSVQVGTNASSIGYFDDGTIHRGLGSITGTAYSAGDWLAIAVDLTAQTVTFRNITQSGSWSSTQPTGFMSGDMYLVVSALHGGDSFTANFDGTLYGPTPDLSYTRWDGSSTGLATAVTGTLTVSQAAQTLSSAGKADVGGILIANQAVHTLSSVGKVDVRGTLSLPQSAQTIAATGGPVVSGALGAPQANQTLSAAASAIAGGNLVAPQAAQTLVAAGAPVVSGTLSIPQAAQTIAANGAVISGIGGTLNLPQAAQTVAAAGKAAVGGTLVVPQTAQTLTAAGWSAGLAALTVLQAPQTVVAGGGGVAGAALNIGQAPETFAGVGRITIGGALAQNQPAQLIGATGALAIGGALATFQAPNVLSAEGAIAVNGAAAAQQSDNEIDASGGVFDVIGGALDLTQADHTLRSRGLTVISIQEAEGHILCGKQRRVRELGRMAGRTRALKYPVHRNIAGGRVRVLESM